MSVNIAPSIFCSSKSSTQELSAPSTRYRGHHVMEVRLNIQQCSGLDQASSLEASWSLPSGHRTYVGLALIPVR
jgi:hypothetical protein